MELLSSGRAEGANDRSQLAVATKKPQQQKAAAARSLPGGKTLKAWFSGGNGNHLVDGEQPGAGEQTEDKGGDDGYRHRHGGCSG